MALITLVLMKAPMQGRIWVKSWMKKTQKGKKEEATIEVEERVEDKHSPTKRRKINVASTKKLLAALSCRDHFTLKADEIDGSRRINAVTSLLRQSSAR